MTQQNKAEELKDTKHNINNVLEWAVALIAPHTVILAQQWTEGEGLTEVGLHKHLFPLCFLYSIYEVTSGGIKIMFEKQ